MKKQMLFTALVLWLLPGFVLAQASREEVLANKNLAAGIYSVYHYSTADKTPAPKGYSPFYISHYGRHGSRWLTSEHYYSHPLEMLQKAHNNDALSAKGEAVLEKMQKIAVDAEDRYGALSEKGVKEHKGIAGRMFLAYPEVFSTKGSRDCIVYSRSTTVPRCIVSMAAFNERLKEQNPEIQIKYEAFDRNHYLNNRNTAPTANRAALEEKYAAFFYAHFDDQKFLSSLFAKGVDPKQYVEDAFHLIFDLYSVAGDLQDTELGFSMWDIFTDDELFTLYQTSNLRMYYICGPSALNGAAAMNSAKPLLKNILDCADAAIKNENISADLRFGHDVYTIPLLALMDIENMNLMEPDPGKVHQYWCDYKVSPMGVNLQLIFYKSKAFDDILVKLLHCEKEISIPVKTDNAPYYHWSDVKAYYEDKLMSTN